MWAFKQTVYEKDGMKEEKKEMGIRKGSGKEGDQSIGKLLELCLVFMLPMKKGIKVERGEVGPDKVRYDTARWIEK
ncbi:unnamed protein product [Enterobius vermicularis]|uniref:Uncharacterized protein n=1 Tax=Enterobius vermicularis TaxID=51028 RepID=A0A0N4VBS8_ENTVE|nr:unnamed protein product [Enterobius vermicularis]